MVFSLKIFGAVLVFVLSFVASFTIDRKLCNGISLERHEELVPIVISAHVINVTDSGNNDVIIDSESVTSPEYSALVQIKRVFKGNDLISKIPPVLPKNGLFSNYNKKITVYGFHSNGDFVCVSDIRKGDTRILFLDYSDVTQELELHPPIVPLSLYHLDRVGAAVKGKFYPGSISCND